MKVLRNPQILNFPKFLEENGSLFVYEGEKEIPFIIQRIFTISSKKGDVRGDHAHKNCNQLLICLSGKVLVSCDNGSEIFKYILDDAASGLLIPECIWAKQEYLTDNAVLMVICNEHYKNEDYIRDYKDFKRHLISKD